MSTRAGSVIASFAATYVIASLTYANVWIWLTVGMATSHARYGLYYLVYAVGLIAVMLLAGRWWTTLSSLRCVAAGAMAGLLVSALALEIVSLSVTSWSRYAAEWRGDAASLLVRDFGVALMLQGWTFGAIMALLARLFITRDWRRVGQVAAVVAIVQVVLLASNRGIPHIHFY
jgi:hypothetical protein